VTGWAALRCAAVRKLLVSAPDPTWIAPFELSCKRFGRPSASGASDAVTPAPELLISATIVFEPAASVPSLRTVFASIVIDLPLIVNVPIVGVTPNPALARATPALIG